MWNIPFHMEYSIPYLVQSSDEGIGTTLSDDTVDVGQSASEERWAFIEIEPDWDQDKYWQQKTWENSITRCAWHVIHIPSNQFVNILIQWTTISDWSWHGSHWSCDPAAHPSASRTCTHASPSHKALQYDWSCQWHTKYSPRAASPSLHYRQGTLT